MVSAIPSSSRHIPLQEPGEASLQSIFKYHYLAPADNSCLFWALLHSVFLPLKENRVAFSQKFQRLFNTQDSDETFYQKLIQVGGSREWILRFRQRLADYMQEKGCNAEHVEKLKDYDTWGDTEDIQYFAELMNIRIYLESGEGSCYFGPSNQPVSCYLTYDNSHYNYRMQNLVKFEPFQAKSSDIGSCFFKFQSFFTCHLYEELE